MRTRQTIHLLASLTLMLSVQLRTNSQNQLYLAEMPRVDRVLREIQGKDPADTAARQMAAFKQLRRMIEDLAWNLDHRYMTKLTPIEKQISDAYEIAYSQVWQADPDKSPNNMHGLENDLRLRDELLTKFFSPNFRAMFLKSFVDEENRKKAKAQAEVDQMNSLRAQFRLQHMGTTDPGTLQARRCGESGRDPLKCGSEAIGQELKEWIIDPMFPTKGPKAGLRLNGVYKGANFTTAFFHGMGTYSASVKCADLEPEQREYAIELTNNQVVVRVTNDAGPISFVLSPNGNLVGSTPVTINGRIIAGYTQHWVEERYTATNQVVPGSGHYVRTPIYKPKTARCTPGPMIPQQFKKSDSEIAGLFATFANLMGADVDQTPGLRLVGIFDGGPGINLEFHPDSGTVGCREATVAHQYTVVVKESGEVTINLSGPGAAVFSYLANGSIRGPGELTVAGRKILSGDGPASTNGLNYMSWTDTCTFTTLTPTPLGTRLDLNPLALAPPPKQTTGPANAVLSLSSGFPENGVQPALRERTFLLVTDDFESILWDTNYPPAPIKNFPAIAMWRQACEVDQQLCLVGSKEAAKRRAALVKFDANGQGTFPAVPAGTYYVLGQMIFNNKHYVWNYRVDLAPGQTNLKLTDLNATLK